MTSDPFQPRLDELPPVLPIFPLSGALLLPGGKLPLNIFEPRYLALVENALGAGRLIGMIQPSEEEEAPEAEHRRLYKVGCVGRICAFSETDDGRYLITLKGVIRFRVGEELDDRGGYRLVRPDYTPYADDLAPPPQVKIDRRRLLAALSTVLSAHDMPLNAKALDHMDNTALMVTTAMVCPFDAREKQALIEAPTAQERADMLQALLEMARFPSGGKAQ